MTTARGGSGRAPPPARISGDAKRPIVQRSVEIGVRGKVPCERHPLCNADWFLASLQDVRLADRHTIIRQHRQPVAINDVPNLDNRARIAGVWVLGRDLQVVFTSGDVCPIALLTMSRA